MLGSGVFPSSRMGITYISKGNGGESALLHKMMYYNEGVFFEALYHSLMRKAEEVACPEFTRWIYTTSSKDG